MRKLRWYDYITYNTYWFALSMGSGSLTPIILPLLVQQFVDPSMKNTFNGLQRAAGLAVAIMVQPAAGLLSDRSTSRWGRRRPFIAAGALLTALFVAGLLLVRSYWALLGAVLLIQFASNIAHGALQGIIPDLVPEQQRGRASAAKSVLDLAPTVVAGLTIARLVGRGQLSLAVGILCAIYAVAMLITVVGVREAPNREPPTGSVAELLLRTLGLLLGMAAGALVAALAAGICGAVAGLVTRMAAGPSAARLVGVSVAGLVAITGAIVAGVWAAVHLGTGDARRHPAFTWWVVNRLAFLAAVGAVMAFGIYFLQDVIRLPNPAEAMGTLQAVVGVFTLVAALASGFLADRFGPYALLRASGIVAAVGIFLLLAATDVTTVQIAGCLIGVGTGLFFTTNWTLGTELVPPEEAGRFLGISNLAGAGAGIVASGIGGRLADYLNSGNPGLGYQVVFAIFGVCFLLSALTLAWARRPTVVGAGAGSVAAA